MGWRATARVKTMPGRRGSWAPGTPSPNGRVPRLPTSQSTISENSRSGRRVHDLARSGGPGRTRQGEGPRSIR
jgi:hypothetical protein